MWVTVVSGTILSMLTKPTLDFAACKLLLSLVPFQAFWSGPLLALQSVSCCCPWHPFKPADLAHPWLYSQWVAAAPDALSSLLTKLALGSAVSELLLSLTPFQASWQTPPLTLQPVSCCQPWHPFKPAEKAPPWLCREWVSTVSDILSSLLTKHPWLCSLWVAAVSETLSSLLIKPTLGSADCEFLLYLALFQPFWSSPPLALQDVSFYCPWHPFKHSDQAYPWLCRMWVATALGTLSSLLNKPTLGSVDSEFLLSLSLFQTY